LRLDAIPYLCERPGTNNENLPETHAVIKRIRGALDARYEERMLLGEANQWPEDVRPYFGEGDECHMAYHFPLMPRIYMALAQEDRHPITDIMRQTPDIPAGCQWAIFLRNHDELTLEMVTDSERDYLWRHYAAEQRARLNLGIRRRLAPLLENDRRKIELLNSLLMSMPGTPIIYYGDEIGMGDNVFLGDRDGVRTPMQWSPDRNAGFSQADPARLFLPPIMDPVYGFEAVNVEAQSRSPSSLLNWMKRLIAARKAHLAFGRGSLTFLYPGNRKVLAYLREWEDDLVLCVANLSRAAQPVELDLATFRDRVPIELMGNSPFPPIGELPYFITLPGYGFYWFVLAQEAKAPSWHEPFAPPAPELTTLVFSQGWSSLSTPPLRRSLEERIIPDYLRARRWFAAKDERIARLRPVALAELPAEAEPALFLTVSVAPEGGGDEQLYAVPLAIAWEDGPEDRLAALRPYTLARVRRASRTGLLHDAMADDGFVRGLVRAMKEQTEVACADGGRLVFTATAAMPEEETAALPIQRSAREQSNSSVQFGDRMVLKLYRRLQPGIHPEVEMGRHLTEVAGFRNMAPLLGFFTHVDTAGTSTALGILVQYMANQGDGWSFTLDYLKRFFEEADLLSPSALGEVGTRHADFVLRMEKLGMRIGEMHQTLAIPTRDRAFAPVAIRAKDLARWRARILLQARRAVAALRRLQGSLAGHERESVIRLLKARRAVVEDIASVMPPVVEAMKTRCHGDLHLGQVLVREDDFVLLDFEGEPSRPVAERRVKQSPLRDVAGMLRSFDYVAAVALKERAAIRPESITALAPLAEDWRQRAKAAFLDGYRKAIVGSPSFPADDAVVCRLIRLFMLEKALYEVCYEAANRPEWIETPVSGVLELLEAGS
jgi:maltose alpha-D-glucosyltransferase/alpha-amylase